MSSALLELRGVCKSFSGKRVLNGLDLDISPGRSLVVIGGSGTGKSVALKCALGLLGLDGGSVYFDGVDMSEGGRTERMRRCTGMLFQGGGLFDSMTVWENVAFTLLYRDRMKRSEARERALETLLKLRLEGRVADQMPAELSGGMRKRVGLARAIVDGPGLLFFDEPTTGLDPITADAVNDLILEQVKALGAAAVTITHDMASARKIADEIAMLFEGRIIWRGAVDRINDSGNAYVDQFVHGRAEGPIQPKL